MKFAFLRWTGLPRDSLYSLLVLQTAAGSPQLSQLSTSRSRSRSRFTQIRNQNLLTKIYFLRDVDVVCVETASQVLLTLQSTYLGNPNSDFNNVMSVLQCEGKIPDTSKKVCFVSNKLAS